ncbi:MAG: outer membrane beta-barrel domain-containing protein [Thermodesulfobacteriota bacterium]|nr:outer membrane beta-barrel domain-containing protein [Thermodesulfobacteriota bacterium]
MKKLCVFSAIVILTFCYVPNCFCEEPQDEEQVFAIQNRIFHRYHEIGAWFNYIPDDDFYDIYGVGISYTFNFNDYLAWEVVRGVFAINQEKDLKDKLIKQFGLAPTGYTEPEYLIHSHFVFKPLYGKDAMWNGSIINHESYLFLGGGVVRYEKRYNYGAPTTEDIASLSFGFGMKYFLNENICLNLEIRDLVNFKDDVTENNVSFGIGIGLRFNLSPRKTGGDSTIEILNEYLKDEKNE